MQVEQENTDSGNSRGWLSWSFIRRNIIRGFKFALAGGAGFIVAEFILFLGLVIVGVSYIVAIDVFAGVLSVAFGFVINEYWTSRNEGDHSGKKKGFAFRLVKFELVYGLGNIISFGVQILLLQKFGLDPLIGNIAGAIAALPVNYFISMLAVWRIRL